MLSDNETEFKGKLSDVGHCEARARELLRNTSQTKSHYVTQVFNGVAIDISALKPKQGS